MEYTIVWPGLGATAAATITSIAWWPDASDAEPRVEVRDRRRVRDNKCLQRIVRQSLRWSKGRRASDGCKQMSDTGHCPAPRMPHDGLEDRVEYMTSLNISHGGGVESARALWFVGMDEGYTPALSRLC